MLEHNHVDVEDSDVDVGLCLVCCVWSDVRSLAVALHGCWIFLASV